MAVKMFAAISIGSSVTEMKIFEFSSRRVMKEIEWMATRINLGLDAYTMHRISPKHVDELCAVLCDFKRVMNGYHVEAYRACATSAFRESRNMSILCDYVEKQTGIHMDVISNAEQRFIDYQAIASLTGEFEKIIQNATAIVDIGGSSIQISLFDKDKLITTQNIRVGNITTKERLAPLVKNREHFEKMVTEIMAHELAGFSRLYQKDRKIRNLIVVGGNLQSLFGQTETEETKIPAISKEQFQAVYDRVVGMTPDEISETFGLSSDITGGMVPSAVFCRCLMESFDVDVVWLPGFSLADGIAYEYGTKKKYVVCSHSFDEDIIAAARSMAKRYKSSQPHIRNLEEIGLQVFDRMKKIHGMGKRERLLLQISIILHNCGKFISLEDVSECAYNIILATEIIGLSHVERAIIAYTVKYNTSPFIYYDDLTSRTDLGQEHYLIVSKLTAILRIANALDRTHLQKCKNVTVALKEHELRVSVASQEDLSLERGAFEEKADFFEEVFHVRPVFKQKKTF